MAQYMVPLIRSGALWLCGRKTGLKAGRKFWPSILRWWGGSRPNQSPGPAFLNSTLKPGKPRY